MTRVSTLTALLVAAALTAAACGNNPTPNPVPPDPMPGVSGGSTTTPRNPPAPPGPPANPPSVPMDPSITTDPLATATPEEINQNSPFSPAFFGYDSDQLDDTARQALTENMQVLRKYPGWVITIEGHCDERGTPEYNLALGDRRALAAKTFLVSLGVSPDRIRTVSYGKEFPFDPGHDDAAWAQNRRAQIVVVANNR